jgi:long-chain acyl-CoA synthetase
MNKHQIHPKREFESIRHIVEYAADIYGERTAFSYKTKPSSKEKIRVSYTEFRDDVRGLATEMLARGMQNKHVVAVGKMSYDFIVTYYATLLIGAVLVPLDKDWNASDLADTAKNADIDYLFIDGEIAGKSEEIVSVCKLAEPVVFLGTDGEEGLRMWINAGRVKFAEDSAPYFNVSYDMRKLSLLVYTSGTTGKGKGVMLCTDSLIRDMTDVIPYIDFEQKTVSVLPPHHTYGSTVMLIAHVMIGTEVYISDGIKYVVHELKSEKPGHLILVPLYLETFYRKIQATLKKQGKQKLVRNMMALSGAMRKATFGLVDIKKKVFAQIREAFGGEIKTIITGGAPINQDIIDFFQGVGISVLNGYGITECAPLISVNRSRNIVKGSVGNLLDMDDVKILDPNEDGEGEICVKGPNVMLGYYKNEEATTDAIDEDGYFRTGDYGKLTKDRILYITGRKKNLIILSNGKNVYPEEIENELISVPGVQDIIVYEGKSRRGMEFNAIVAEVVPDKEFIEKNGITDVKAYLDEFIHEYNKTAVAYKKITVVKVREEDFPKNTLRKIMRFKIDMTID